MRVVQMKPFSAPSSNTSHFQRTEPVPPKEKKPVLDIRRFERDDWILLGIIAALVMDGCTDYILLIALGYLFIAGL